MLGSMFVVPETHFPEYILSRHVGIDDGSWGTQLQRKLNNQSLPWRTQSPETKHQHIKWHENSYKATNQQVQTNILWHKLNACGNVWLPKQRDGARHFGPWRQHFRKGPFPFVNSEINISSKCRVGWMILTLLKKEKGGNFQGQFFWFYFPDIWFWGKLQFPWASISSSLGWRLTIRE